MQLISCLTINLLVFSGGEGVVKHLHEGDGVNFQRALDKVTHQRLLTKQTDHGTRDKQRGRIQCHQATYRNDCSVNYSEETRAGAIICRLQSRQVLLGISEWLNNRKPGGGGGEGNSLFLTVEESEHCRRVS